MKKFLLSFILFGCILFSNKAQADACDLALSNLTLTVRSLTGSGPYTIGFDLSFYINNNGGNKSIYINLWNSTKYATGAGEFNWTAGTPKMPKLNEMDGPSGGFAPIGIVGLEIGGTSTIPTAAFVPYYSSDPTNISSANNNLLSGSSITVTYISTVGDPNFGKTKFQINALTFTNTPSLSFKGNVWGSQSPTANTGKDINIQCYDDLFDFTAGEVKINAASSFNCSSSPRTFQLFLDATASSSNPTQFTYKVYVDDNGNNQVDAGEPVGYTSASNLTVYDVNTTQPDYNSMSTALGNPYGTQSDVFRKNLIVIVTYSNSLAIINLQNNLANACAALPVSFKSLSATRNKSNVVVKWTTATESNNKGFNVQRNINGTWETVAFVFSAATGGNSTSDLSYSFNDANGHKGVSQYRIQQVDIDGKSKLSEIRSVKGEAMAAKLVVYPNPSETGRVNMVFEDGAPKNVQVSDMSGRVVRSLKNVANNVSIEGLENGVYSIQVTDLSSAGISVEKVIIKKR